MSLQFRKRVKVLPGLTLNFSQSGVSTSVGGKGGRLTFGKRGVTSSFGIPGTGIYDRTTHSWGAKTGRQGPTPSQADFINRMGPFINKMTKVEKRVSRFAAAGELWKVEPEARQLLAAYECLAENVKGVYKFSDLRKQALQSHKELGALLDALPDTGMSQGEVLKPMSLPAQNSNLRRWAVAGACLLVVLIFGLKFEQRSSSTPQAPVTQAQTYKVENK